jgi:sugar phosphate isomerase/epimerase
MADRLGTWARVMEEHRGVLAIKAHIGNAMQTPEATVWLLNEVGSKAVHAAYDHGHFDAQGMVLDETMAVLLPRTSFIHIKDSRVEGGQRRWVLPGEGSIDYASYARLLNQRGYTKPVVIEVSSQIFNKPNYDPVLTAETAYRYMKPFFGARQFRQP